MARIEEWGSAIGESLIAGDLAALIAHKRATAVRLGTPKSLNGRAADHGIAHRWAPLYAEPAFLPAM